MGWRYKRTYIRRFAAQHGKCYLCGGPMCLHKYTRDHVTPLSKGGMQGKGNQLLAHSGCNRRKADDEPTLEQISYLRHVNRLVDTFICFKWVDNEDERINNMLLRIPAGVV